MKSPATNQHPVLAIAFGAGLARSAVRRALAPYPHLHPVVEASDFQQLTTVLRSHPLKVLLVFELLPGMARIEDLAPLIPREAPPRLVFTIRPDIPEERLAALLALHPYAVVDIDLGAEDLAQVLHLVLGGMRVYCDAAVALHPTLASRLPASHPHSPLTPREAQLLLLLAHGHPDRVIAERMGVSLRTLYAHLAQVRHKLDATNRVHAVALAISQALISVREPA